MKDKDFPNFPRIEKVVTMLVNRKPLKLRLVGLDGNAFSLLGAFQKQARKEGWTPEEIKTVMDAARSSDYDHLLGILADHCEDGGF